MSRNNTPLPSQCTPALYHMKLLNICGSIQNGGSTLWQVLNHVELGYAISGPPAVAKLQVPSCLCLWVSCLWLSESCYASWDL